MPPLKLNEIREVVKTVSKQTGNDEDKELKEKISLLSERRTKTPGYISLRNLDS